MNKLLSAVFALSLCTLACRTGEAIPCHVDDNCPQGEVCRADVCVSAMGAGGSGGGSATGGGVGGGSATGGGDGGGSATGGGVGGGSATGGGVGGGSATGGGVGGGSATGGGVGGGSATGGGVGGGSATGGGVGGGSATGGGVGGGSATGGGVGGGSATGGGVGGGSATGGGAGGGIPNRPPVPTSPLATINAAEGTPSSVTLVATDPDGDTLTYALAPPLQTFVTLSNATTLTINADFTQAGTYVINWTVSDGIAAPVPASFRLVVANTNRAPTLAPVNNVTMVAGTTTNVSFVGTDLDGDTLTYTVTPTRSYATVTGPVLTLSPPLGTVETFMMNVTVSDPSTATASRSFTLTVNAPPNQPPTIGTLEQADSSGGTIAAGATVTFTPSFRAAIADPENQSVQLAVEVVPTASMFTNTATVTSTLSAMGTVTVSLGSLMPGAYKWQGRALDGQGAASAWTPFNNGQTAFTIISGPVAGTVVINGNAAVTSSANVTLTFTDGTAQGGSVTEVCFSNTMTFAPVDCLTNPPASGSRMWPLAVGQDGQRTVNMRVRDNANQTAIFSDSIVLDVNAPTGSVTVNGGQPFTNNATLNLAFTTNDGTGTGVTDVCVLVLPQNTVPGTPPANDPCFQPIGSVTSKNITGNEGSYRVWAYFKDGAGWVSTGARTDVGYDTSPPQITSAALNSGDQYTNLIPFVTFNNSLAMPDLSGPAQVCVGLTSTPNNCVPYAAAPTIDLTGGGMLADGTVQAFIRVVDNAGNTSLVSSDTIIVDRTKPTVLSFVPPTFTNQLNFFATLTGSDALSGVASKTVTNELGSTFSYLPTGTTVGPITVGAGDGLKTLTARVVDNASNTSAPLSANTLLDQTRPSSPQVTLNAGATATNVATVSVTLVLPESIASTPTTSGLSKMCVRDRDSATVSTPPPANDPCFNAFAGVLTSFSYTLTATGTRLVDVWLQDGATNVASAAGIGTVIFDNQNPNPPGAVSVVAGHRSLKVTWAPANDPSPGSGIDHYVVYSGDQMGGPYDQNITIPGTATSTTLTLPNEVAHFVAIAAFDVAGNSSTTIESSGTPHYPFTATYRNPSTEQFNGGGSFGGLTYLVGRNGNMWTASSLAPAPTTNFARVDPMTDGDLTAVSTNDPDFVWAVGASGHISYKSPSHGSFRLARNGSGSAALINDISYAGTFQGQKFRVAVGSGGLILRSVRNMADGAFVQPSFNTVTSGVSVGLNAVTLCEDTSTVCNGGRVLIAVGDTGTILRSIDSGATWSLVPAPMGYTSATLSDVAYMKGTQTLYISAKAGHPFNQPFLVSNDGGATWFAVSASQGVNNVLSIVRESASLLRFSSGTASAATLGSLSTSGTVTIDTLPSFSTIPTGLYYALVPGVSTSAGVSTVAAGASGNVIGVVQGQSSYASYVNTTANPITQFSSLTTAPTTSCGGRVFATAGPGTQLFYSQSSLTPSWTAITGPSGFGQYLGAAAPASNTLFIVGPGGKISQSTNADTASPTFTAMTSNTTNLLRSIQCSSATSCVAAGDSSTILFWNGTTWAVHTPMVPALSFSSVSPPFLDGSSVRYFLNGPGGLSFRFDVGISTGATQTTAPSAGWTGGSAGHGAGIGGTSVVITVVKPGMGQGIYRSTDLGTNWNLVNAAGAETVQYLGGTVFVAFNTTTVFRSEDDGLTWTTYPTNQSNALSASTVCVPQLNGGTTRLFGGSSNGALYHSLNGGKGG